MKRENISTGGKWEPILGYSRAVKVGQFVYVSGCTAATPEGIVGGNDPYLQAVQTIKTIVTALEKAGAGPEHVVRTRIFMTDISQWEQIAKAHGEVFGSVRPATTLLEVSKLIDPGMLVEIEADAIVPE